ncbi:MULTISPECIES: TonB-dependent receptor [Gammaproteobacteria]|uniref:TonB-dependent receptor n=1 Tax=Gammaproteobacteria TaxID=1236 RepID=UPI000DD0ABD4|nr:MULTISPECIES: TonB-dependent receptor [Gammaproteobacteria]RTE86287.1 TonB-dependent receptor [Aliidiomarina sp. B3213]TCZ91638.1 TonB-dependent receptor [Lysobacter sp. N42]
MKKLTFMKSPVAAAVSLVLASSFITPLYAQDAQEQEEQTEQTQQTEQENFEVIEVRGIVGSLARSTAFKRDSSGIVDAISAEEMGKFPDTNLAESLQRITGVSVSRVNGEGSQITVRGFGPEFNLITLNGRQMPGTGYTRSYNLENLSSEGVNALEVYKTARAATPSGGLGATVNIVTTQPLERPGQRFSVSGRALHDSSVADGSDVTPEVAAVYSNTFADDRFGVAFSFSQYRRDFQIQQANIQGWQANVPLPGDLPESSVIDPRPVDEEGNRVGNHFFPKDMNYGIADLAQERTNGQLTLQFEPINGLVLTTDYTASRNLTGREAFGWGIWNEFGGNINAYELDENGTAVYADIAGNDGSFTAEKGTTETEAESVGFNLEYQLSDSWSFWFDAHDSSNKTDDGADAGSGMFGQVILGSDQLRSKVYDYRTGEIPQVLINWNNGTNVLDPASIDSNFSQFFHRPGESNITQYQFKTDWYNYGTFDVPLVKVTAGLSRTDQEMGGYTAWSGLRGGPGFNPSFAQILPDSMFTYNGTGSFLDELLGGGSNLLTDYYYTYDFDEAVARQMAYITEALMGSDAYVADPYFDGIDSESYVNEVTNALFIQSDWEFYVADFPVQLNVGVRYEETDVTSRVRQSVERQVNWVSPSEWIMQYEPSDQATFLTLEGNHDVLLPSLDFKVELTPDLIGRFSYGKTIARAPLGDLAGGRSLSGSPKPGSRSGGQGNTNLLPFESTNFDLSLEYYYDFGSYAAIGYFRKEVDNFIQRSITTTTIDGLRDILNGPRYAQAVASLEERGEQATSTNIFNEMIALGFGNGEGVIEPNADDPLMEWQISQPTNTDTKTVDGFEIAVQHVFGESGFGLGVNATVVDGDVDFDNESLTQQSPLVGLSDSANFQGFYEKHGLSVKVTYAWRDSYLIGVGQAQGSADAPPQYAREYGQWDMSVNYNFTENFSVSFEGLNLTNETEQGYGRYEEQFLFARQYGPRYSLGFRYSF